MRTFRKNPMKKKSKTFKKPLNKSKTFKNKVNRKKLGAGPPPDNYKHLSPLEQAEKVLQLVEETTMNEIVMDDKTRRPVVVNNITLSKLTYWNAHQLMMQNGSGNRDDMQNIVYMLKHDALEHKNANKDIWKKHLSDAIFKGKYMSTFQDKSYNGPMINLNKKTNIKMKDMVIAILKNRIEIIKWLNQKKIKNAETKRITESKKIAESKRIAESNKRAENITIKRNSTPNNWENLNENN